MLRTSFRPLLTVGLPGLTLCLMLAAKFPAQLAGKNSAESPPLFPAEAIETTQSAKVTEPVSERNNAAPRSPIQTEFLTKFQTNQRPDFQTIVRQNFGHWTSNGQIALSDDRIKELILDPDVRGAEAAALAAIHIYWVYQRNAGNDRQALTLAFLTSPEHGHARPMEYTSHDPYSNFREFAHPIEMATQIDLLPRITPSTQMSTFNPLENAHRVGPVIRPRVTDRSQSPAHHNPQYFNRLYGEMAANFNLSRYFNAFRQHLDTVPRQVFAVEKPSLEGISQGPLGDCYFLAEVGALLNHRPDRFNKFIYLKSKGSYEVRFPNGQHVHVPPLTDAQLALGSTAGKQGIWLNILEVAAGIIRQRQERQDHELALDVLGNGGLPGFSVQLLTGNASMRHTTQYRLRSRAPLPASASIASEISKLIKIGLHDGRLVSCSSYVDVPPGMGGCHEYAIIGLSDNQVEIWNPWGTRYNFTPNGPSGLEHGYLTRRGRFAMPFDDFLHAFEYVNIESR